MTPPPRSLAHAALEIIRRLRDSGHTALLAGGCVRDMLLERTAKDYDVATDARPERIATIFPGAKLVGAKFGVILVRKFGHDVEVATFRADGPYTDGRHPDTVVFGNELDDARRRDFTINGLFFDPLDDRVIDHVAGRADLDAKLIRAIGDPGRRFGEDYLRMLRAVRFAARLGFEVEPATADAIRRHADRLPGISPERIWMELEQILVAPTRACGWEMLTSFGLCDFLIRGWRPSGDDRARIARRLEGLPSQTVSPYLALSAMLGGESPPRAEELCRELRLSNRETETVVWMLRALPQLADEAHMELADLKILMAGPVWAELVELLDAHQLAAGQDRSLGERLRRRAADIPPAAAAPPPLLSGDDLSAIGMTPGPRFGEILKAVYRAQLNQRITSKDQARELAKRLIRED